MSMASKNVLSILVEKDCLINYWKFLFFEVLVFYMNLSWIVFSTNLIDPFMFTHVLKDILATINEDDEEQQINDFIG
jgi:hypothetical protein